MEKLVLFLCPESKDNILMYNCLFNNKNMYIKYGDFSKVKINGQIYIQALNLGNRHNVYLRFKQQVNTQKIKYICWYIAINIADIVIINKVINIDEGIRQLDIALDLGKDIYAIPGDIFNYKNYLANFSIKQGAIPICSKYDMDYILKEKKYNVL